MVTALYAGILALFFVWMSFQVVGRRRSQKIAIGVGEDEHLSRLVRAHGHFAEYVPFTLFLLFLAEQFHLSIFLIHLMGVALIVARVLHFISLTKLELKKQNYSLRVMGMVTNVTVIILLAMYLVAKSVLVQTVV